MNKIVNNLINKELALEEQVKLELEKRFKKLDLNDILAQPSDRLLEFSTQVIDEVFMKFAPQYVVLGNDFVAAVKKKKEPVVIV